MVVAPGRRSAPRSVRAWWRALEPDGRRAAAARWWKWAVPFVGVSALVAVPFLLVARSNTLYFVQFNRNGRRRTRSGGCSAGSSDRGSRVAISSTPPPSSSWSWPCWPGRGRCGALPVEHQASGVALGSAIALIAWMAVNKVWNPQYLLWVFAAGAIASAPPALGVALGAVTVWDWWFEFVLRIPDHQNQYAWIGYTSVVARTVVFALMVGWCALELRRLGAVRAPRGAGSVRSVARMTGTVGAPAIEAPAADTARGPRRASRPLDPIASRHGGAARRTLRALRAPTVAGHAFLDGDNFLQNFPLRALVGRDLLHGTLPLWNPYLFSGTPLLGGFNAGAAYPATWLMAILPLRPRGRSTSPSSTT